MSKLRFVWEFFGPESNQLAKHHHIHLDEFFAKENISNINTGVEQESSNFSFSYVIIDDSYLELIKASLRPHKAFKEQ